MKITSQLSITLLLCFGSVGCVAQSGSDAITVLKSSPAAGATLTEAPQSVRIWFDRVPESEDWELALVGASEERKVSYIHTIGENDLMGMLLEPIPDGKYTLRWRWEGHSGELSFIVE